MNVDRPTSSPISSPTAPHAHRAIAESWRREEAERVRTIFRPYLDLGSIGLLLGDLRERGIVTKIRHLCDGRTVGGIPFTRGPLAYLLALHRRGGLQGRNLPGRASARSSTGTYSKRFSKGSSSSAVASAPRGQRPLPC
jgi:hypothetical protein